MLKTIPDDPELPGAWNSLVLGMENQEVFFTHQWALAVSRGFQKKLNPLLFLIYESDQLAGVAAFAVEPCSPRAVCFLASSTADYCDIVSKPENRREVLLASLRELKNLGFRDLVLASVPATSATLAHLPAIARETGFHAATRASFECGIIKLADDQQRKALVQTVAAKSREKRGLKKLLALGSVDVVHVSEPRQIESTLDAIVSAQVSRFLVSGRVSPLLDPERRAFLTELGKLLAHAGWLKLSQLEIGGRSIAWNYGFSFAGSWFWYLPAFQIRYEHASPGSCLLRLLVEEACCDPTVRWLDLGLGDESYKVRFANSVRHTRYIQLSYSYPRHVVKVGRQKLAAAVTHRPRLENNIRSARERYRRLLGRIRGTGLVATTQHSLNRATKAIASRSEVLIFQAPGKETEEEIAIFETLSDEHLVQAAIRNADDPDTLAYLMRCAKRMSQPGVSGFALQNEDGESLHFLWVASYDGFHIEEVDQALKPVSKDAAMIFDCWTPVVYRGHGYYATALRCAAARLYKEGRTAWIFSDANNTASLRGISKAGFVSRFSLLRHRRFGQSVVLQRETTI